MDDFNQNGTALDNDSLTDLGQEISSFSVKNIAFKRWAFVVFSIFTILSSLILFLFYLFNTRHMIDIHGLAILLRWVPLFPILIILGFVLGLITLAIARLLWHNGVTLYQNGMVLRKNQRTLTWMWKEISSLDTQMTAIEFAGSDVAQKVRLIMKTQQGKELIIKNQFNSMDQLLLQIRLSVIPILYERACIKLANEERLKFHKEIVAAWNGLIIREQLIPYSEFDKPQINKNHLELILNTENIQKYKFNLHQISNLDLLLHLLTYPPREN